jgi:ABC-type spermidine/putrescine transport system permease subunit I
VLWHEFFNNRDWPVASALAVVMLAVLIIADHPVQPQPGQRAGGVPMLSLIIYSFNENRLVTVWSGFSTKWYGACWTDDQMLAAAWVSLRIAFYTAIARRWCSAPWRRWC